MLGSTSPAFLFLLSALGFLFGTDRVDEVALAANAVFLAAATVLAYLVMRDLTGRALPSLLAAALVGFSSVNVFILAQGFEAGLLTAILLGGTYLARTGRDLPAVVLASLAPLVRPEGLLLTPLVWGPILLARRFRPRLVVAYLALPVVWIVFAGAYYGSPVPQSIRARAAEPSVFRPYSTDRVDLRQRLRSIGPETVALARYDAGSILFTGYQRWSDAPSGGLAWLSLLGLPALALTLFRRPDARIVYVLYPLLFLLLYGWIGYRQAWYFPSFVTFALLTLFFGGVVTLDQAWAGRQETRPVAPLLPALSWVGVAALLFSANSYALGARDGRGPWLAARNPKGEIVDRAERERYNGYRRAAAFLNRRSARLERALISEVGIFGFFYRGDVIDTVGLCTPEALAYYPPPVSDIWDEQHRPLTDMDNLTPTRMVLELKPTYVVNGLGFVRNLLRPGSPFLREYALIGNVGTAWGDPLLVFERKP